MIYKSRWFAFFISIPITTISVLVNVYTERFSANEIAIIAFVIFSISFVISFVVFEILIFRRITILKSRLDKLLGKYDSKIEQFNQAPFKGIIESVEFFHNKNREEIKELKRLADFRKEFIADVSHELKTPIFAAQGFVHTLLDGAFKDISVREEFLKKAAKSLDGLDLLVQDLMTLSLLETGEIRMNFEYFDIYGLCQEIFDQFERRANKKKISLGFESATDEQEILVYADSRRIYHVLSNLISNAINYTNEGGEAKVGFEPGFADIRISVRDTGMGIPENEINNIFKRFYRVDKSRSRKQGGTGLGLAIVKHIIELHKSTIEVESKEMQGSKFTFKLLRTKPSWLDEVKE